MPQQRRSRNGNGSGNAARGSTLLLTNATKVVGLTLAINEAVVRGNARDSVIAFSALCVLGAQVAENLILATIDRFFARQPAGRSEEEEGS